MYTVCWTENGKDCWDRFECRRAVAAFLIEHGLEDDEDVLIFTPEADECTMTTEDIFASI